MSIDVGEYLVGAYLQVIKECDIVSYNQRPPGGGLEGLGELDVIGLDFKSITAYLCEVTTHIRGVLYKTYDFTVDRITEKYQRQKQYATKQLAGFRNKRYMFWAPVVPKGKLTARLSEIKGLELVINGDYARCVKEMQDWARENTHDTTNPFLRMLQILEHLRS